MTSTKKCKSFRCISNNLYHHMKLSTDISYILIDIH